MALGPGAIGDDERSFCPTTVRDVACNLQDLRLANRAGVAWSCSHRPGTYQLSDASSPWTEPAPMQSTPAFARAETLLLRRLCSHDVATTASTPTRGEAEA